METNPNEQSAASIRARLRERLLSGQSVTPLYGVREFGSVDIRKRLSELRNEDGMEISERWETSITTGKHYKVHYMTEEQINNYKQKQS